MSGADAARRDEYAARVVELLGKAVAAGYTNAAHMTKDPVRARPDFRKLLADLTTKHPPRKPAPMPRRAG